MPIMPADFLICSQVAPSFDGWSLLLLLMRFLHIFCSIILLGGLFYLLAVVAPRVVAAGGRGDADTWFNGNRATWARWVGIATALLLVSGLFNFINNVTTYKLVPSYHMLGTLKILLALVVFFFAAILAGKTPLAESFREKMASWLKFTMLLGILIVIIGGVMRNYPRIPKSPANGPTLIAPTN
jgi:uncharacterized membrane protein